MAAAVLISKFADAGLADVRVRSAGTAGYHIGEDADPRARATLREAGYDLNHRATQVSPEMLHDSDLLLAMDTANADDLRSLANRHGAPRDRIRLLRSFDPSCPDEADVPDPYYGGRDGFRDVLDMIEKSADGVVVYVRDELEQGRTPGA